MTPSTQLVRLGIIERSRLGPELATLLGVRMLVGRIIRLCPWLTGDDLSDTHYRPLPHWPGVAKSPAAI